MHLQHIKGAVVTHYRCAYKPVALIAQTRRASERQSHGFVLFIDAQSLLSSKIYLSVVATRLHMQSDLLPGGSMCGSPSSSSFSSAVCSSSSFASLETQADPHCHGVMPYEVMCTVLSGWGALWEGDSDCAPVSLAASSAASSATLVMCSRAAAASVQCQLNVNQCQRRQPTCAAHDRSAAVHELTLPSMPYVPSLLSRCHDPWHANKKTLKCCYSSCMLHSTAFHSVGQPAPLPGCSVTQRQKVKVLPFLFSSELGSSNRSTHIAGLTQQTSHKLQPQQFNAYFPTAQRS